MFPSIWENQKCSGSDSDCVDSVFSGHYNKTRRAGLRGGFYDSEYLIKWVFLASFRIFEENNPEQPQGKS